MLIQAVAEQGLTIIGRACGPRSSNIPNLAFALSSSRAWWSFTHAITATHVQDSVQAPQCPLPPAPTSHYLWTEPMPAASVAAINEACRMAGVNTDPYLPAKGS